jgi:hypothetical protein
MGYEDKIGIEQKMNSEKAKLLHFITTLTAPPEIELSGYSFEVDKEIGRRTASYPFNGKKVVLQYQFKKSKDPDQGFGFVHFRQPLKGNREKVKSFEYESDSTVRLVEFATEATTEDEDLDFSITLKEALSATVKGSEEGRVLELGEISELNKELEILQKELESRINSESSNVRRGI